MKCRKCKKDIEEIKVARLVACEGYQYWLCGECGEKKEKKKKICSECGQSIDEVYADIRVRGERMVYCSKECYEEWIEDEAVLLWDFHKMGG